MASVVLVLLSVSLLFEHAVHGSRAQTTVFVKTGEDLHLQLKRADVPEDYDDLTWLFNKTAVLVKFLAGRGPRVSTDYTQRVEATKGNFSVKLKNLQKSDSGVYNARIAEPNKDQIVAEYLVTVEDPVSPVKLTVDSVTNSSDPCDLTVTCRSLDSHQISISTTVTCENNTCSQQGGERSKVTASGATLKVYLKNYKIICNYSNQVSRTNDTTKIRDFCPEKSVVVNAAMIGSSASAAALVLGLILCVIIYMCRRRDSENTVYAVPQSQAAVQPQRQSEREDSTPTSTYALVQFHTGPDESTRTKVTDMPETVYAEVNKGRKIKPKPAPPRTNTES